MGSLPALDSAAEQNEVGITLVADMPGVSKERLGVKVDGERLLIEGSAEVKVPEKLEPLHSTDPQPVLPA
jgi:HSP20 family protein